jgi:hypothetical protein
MVWKQFSRDRSLDARNFADFDCKNWNYKASGLMYNKSSNFSCYIFWYIWFLIKHAKNTKHWYLSSPRRYSKLAV